MTLQSIDASKAATLIKSGARLIDIREPDEHARENIASGQNIPLSRLTATPLSPSEKVTVFHCRSGQRTLANASVLRDCGGAEAYILTGGIEAWKAAGFPVLKNHKQPIEIMRQVQITAGGFALFGAVLGATVNPAFYALSAAVGAGLLFSGITGSCAMASALRVMPWNRATS
jgi:rhodanese-related sulfurtransferase